MEIAPNTTIIILQNVPLDTTYDHTIYFSNATTQANYFKGKAKYTLTAQQYQRVQRGYMRVDIKAENLYNCNYLMFQNTAFGSKWFYAFIDKVEYINNQVSQIDFSLDVMQTWFFNYKLDPCYVEREHATNDDLFSNLVEERIDLGPEYICTQTDVYDMNDMMLCILAAPIEKTSEGHIWNGIFSPLKRYTYTVSADGVNSAASQISSYVNEGKETSIVAIYQYPTFASHDSYTTAEIPTETKHISYQFTTIDGYTPKNKKLFSYPYNFLRVSNNSGQTADYKYEYWTQSSRGNFNIRGVSLSTPCIMIYPTNYNGIAECYDEGLTYSNFPMCPWIGDSYKQWLAQNKGTIAQGVLSAALATGIAALTITNPAASALDVAGATANMGLKINRPIAQMQNAQGIPPQVYGQGQTDSLNVGMKRVQFNFYSMSVRREFAEIIDDYFTRYGYATHKLKVPNRDVRPHWTYTQTVDCTISAEGTNGGVPSDDAKKICSIYNHGITFWRNGDEVGHYDLDNRPQQGVSDPPGEEPSM